LATTYPTIERSRVNMRSLHSALLAAQKSPSAKPYVRVEVVEKIGAAARFNWSRLYTGEEPDCHNDATMPGDGSLVRIRGGGGIYRQRTPDPGPGSDFSQWYYWGYTGSDVAICSHGAEVLAFWIQSSGWLRRRESSTYGETWGDPIQMNYIGTSHSEYRVAACFKPSGDAIVLYSNGTSLYRRRRINGIWEAAAAWTNSLGSITGIAVTYNGDWNVVITGMDNDYSPGVWTSVLGDGYSMPPDSWSGLREITIASTDSDIEFLAPSLEMPDVFRVFFVEQYNGTEAYSRPYWSHSLPNADFISNLWREPVPLNLSCIYGVALTYHPSQGEGYAWLCAPYGVWRAPISPAWVDVTDDVIEMRSEIHPFSGRLELTLRNDDGRFNSIAFGSFAPISLSSKLNLYLGYHTTEGAKSSLAPAFWIDGWEYVTKGGRSEFILYAHDGWSLLNRWRARRQFTWNSSAEGGDSNIFQLLRFLFARAGLEFSSFSYSNAIFQYPAFTIHPSESGATAVRHLLDMVPDVIMFVTDTAYLINLLSSDTTSYSYGPAAEGYHKIIEGSYRQNAQSTNRAQVYGYDLMTEDWNWDAIEEVHDRLSQVRDMNLDTTEKAHQRGQGILREAEMEAQGGHILVPMNCGQDLYDAIGISSPQAGLDASKRRVLALNHTWGTFHGQIYPETSFRSAINSPFDKGGFRGIKTMRAEGVLSFSFVKEGFLHNSEGGLQ